VLRNRTKKARSIENFNQLSKEMKKSVQMNDDLRHLLTSLEGSSFQHLSSLIISLRFELTEDDRISRFHSKNAEDAAESSNVIVRRKNKRKKP
jgi:L-lactate utilization protein LutB